MSRRYPDQRVRLLRAQLAHVRQQLATVTTERDELAERLDWLLERIVDRFTELPDDVVTRLLLDIGLAELDEPYRAVEPDSGQAGR